MLEGPALELLNSGEARVVFLDPRVEVQLAERRAETAIRRLKTSQLKAVERRDRLIVDLLEKLERARPGGLSEDEQALFARLFDVVRPRRERWYWTADENQAILDLLARRRRSRKVRKPYQRNDEVRLLAERLGRTEWSVRRRMERLSKAGKKRKGSKRG